ncbi:MAG: hypothetical protein V4648_00155 [Bacteroidota bacterium]
MLLGSLLLFMVSCETDSVENTNQNVIGYKYTSETIPTDPALPHYFSETIGNLQNGKFYTETKTIYLNGVQSGTSVTTQRYFYSNNRLDHFDRGDMMIYYYYNSDGDLIGCTGISTNPPGGTLYERYIHLPNNVVYCENMNLPYNDPNAVAGYRKILHLDNDGNVISAGSDPDMDGVAVNIYHYTYVNENLDAMQRPDGTVVTFAHSNVINTSRYLMELSCGKQVMCLPCATIFANGYAFGLSQGTYSKNLTSQEFSGSAFLVMPNGFYNKKTNVTNEPNGSHTEILEYFFN